MSSLWTPRGEHRVPEAAAQPVTDEPLADEPVTDELGGVPLDRETAEALAGELAEARQRLAEAPPEVVVINHAMGLYELAAIHLTSEPPNLPAAALAIDAFAALVDGLGERLGPDVTTLRDALSQVRLGFVQLRAQRGSEAGGAKAPSAGEAPER